MFFSSGQNGVVDESKWEILAKKNIMDQLTINYKALLKRFLVIFAPLVCITVILSWAVYYFQHIKTQVEVLRAQEKNLLDMQERLVQQTLKSIVSDINIIAAHQELQDLLTRKDQEYPSQMRSEFLSFSKYKGIYDQVRILDSKGLEIIRVDLRGNQPFLVSGSKLQLKAERYYFKDIQKLSKGEVFMSPLDLNIERGEIERPLKPMIRFGMPIFTQDGERHGVLIMNYLGKRLIEDLERLTFDSPGHLMLLNADGYWLKGMQPEDEWGFMFQERTERRIQHQYPAVWQKIINDESGQMLIKDGLFTFRKVYPLREGIKSSSGSPKPFEASLRDVTFEEYFWVILSHVLPKDLHRRSDNFILVLILSDLIFLGMLGFVSWQLIVANARRRFAEKALKRANQELEEKIKQKTEELLSANISLKKEIEEHNSAIKEKAKVEFQLRQAQKMEAIGTLAGGIAHDFNNILAAIFGYTDLARIDLDNKANLKRNLEEISNAGLRARDLVQHILTFSRHADIERGPMDIVPLIKETLKFLRASMPTTVEIRQDLTADKSVIVADPTQIHQVLTNLCTNAAYAMKEKGGVLDVCLEETTLTGEVLSGHRELKPGQYLRLTVSDTGYGIPEEILARVFDPFFTTKERGEGTGMGLSVVHGIVTDMGGAISVYSEPGIGTTFHLFLPIYNQECPDTSASVPVARKGSGTILFVDDDEKVVNAGHGILEKLGYRVISTTSSEEALKMFTERPGYFDLVLTDMTMPRLTGIDLSREILAARPDIPVVLCTGYSAGITWEKVREIGIRNLVMKPMIASELAEVIYSTLNPASDKYP